MSEPKKGLASLGLDNAIRLRWAPRDIKGKRLKLTPVDPNDVRALIDMGYVENPKRRSGGDKRRTSRDRSWQLRWPAPPRGAAPPVRVRLSGRREAPANRNPSTYGEAIGMEKRASIDRGSVRSMICS
jgi:hypothetical protein